MTTTSAAKDQTMGRGTWLVWLAFAHARNMPHVCPAISCLCCAASSLNHIRHSAALRLIQIMKLAFS